jgi:hypothetical protein
MNAAVLLPLLLAAAPADPVVLPKDADFFLEADHPQRVQLWLDEYELIRGQRARAFVRAQEDGYLLVLHADAAGRVRILFPLDPHASEYVRGGEAMEIRGRGDREAFLVDEAAGSGVVLAAWSRDPFRYGPVVRGDHWDYRALAPDGAGADPESYLLDLVHWMAAGAAYDYDVAHYLVMGHGRVAPSRVASGYCAGCPYCTGWGRRSSFYVSVGVGGFGCPRVALWRAYSPYSWYAFWYDPFSYPVYVYRPYRLYCDPFFGCYVPARYRPVPYGPFWYPGPRQRHPLYVFAARFGQSGGRGDAGTRSIFRAVTEGSDPFYKPGSTALAELGGVDRRAREAATERSVRPALREPPTARPLRPTEWESPAVRPSTPREQAAPPVRRAAPAEREAAPPVRRTAPAEREAAPPVRPPPATRREAPSSRPTLPPARTGSSSSGAQRPAATPQRVVPQRSTPAAERSSPAAERAAPPAAQRPLRSTTTRPTGENPATRQAAPSARQQPAAPSARQQPAASSARQQPATSSARQQPATSSARQQPAASSARQQPAASSARQQPAASSARQQPAASSARQQPAASSARQQPAANRPSRATTPTRSAARPRSGS